LLCRHSSSIALYNFKGFLSKCKGYEWGLFDDMQGVAMQRPNKSDFNREERCLIEDLR
jgi:hypothetical protein